jgi:hypothetical protein
MGMTRSPRGKSYLYVSDAKVEMLIDDLGPSLRERFDLKLKVDVSGIGGEAALLHPDSGRFARARRLCAALDAQKRIGSIHDEDTEFFRGELLAAWGFWNRYDEGYADVVFFHGFVDERTFVGLGGSAYHTMERATERLQQYSNSGLQALLAFLKERSEVATSHQGVPSAWPAEAWEADHDNSAVPEPIEFVAERLLDGPRHEIRTIIGSPIYVARTGEPVTRSVMKEYDALRKQQALRIAGDPSLKRLRGRRELGKPSSPKLPPMVEPKPTESEET